MTDNTARDAVKKDDSSIAFVYGIVPIKYVSYAAARKRKDLRPFPPRFFVHTAQFTGCPTSVYYNCDLTPCNVYDVVFIEQNIKHTHTKVFMKKKIVYRLLSA